MGDLLTKYCTAALLYLYENNVTGANKSAVLNPVPSEYRERVFNKLWHSNPKYINGNPAIDPILTLTDYGVSEAKKLKIEKYKLDVFAEFQKEGIGNEVVWTDIAKRANIPDEIQDTLKNILYYQYYIVKTSQAQGIGDLVRSQPSIVAALNDIEDQFLYSSIYIDNSSRSELNVAGNIEVIGDGNQIASSSPSSNTTYSAPHKQPNKTIKKVAIGVLVTVIGGLILWGIVELIKSL